VNYCILRSKNLKEGLPLCLILEFEELIKDNLKEGWKLQGGAFPTEEYLYQALIKE